jgi:predicted DNA-binding protein YlxM (UPF0122 family)
MKTTHLWEGKRANHYTAKLTEHDVYLIKGLLKEGLPISEIAEKFEVSKYIISKIKNGHTWKHVPEYGEA